MINKIHPFLWHLICIIISLFFFSLILLNRSPNFIRPLSESLRTGFGLVIPATALILCLAFYVPGRVGQLLSIVSTLSLFAMPLAGLWASGQSQSTVWSGLIPLYDAGGYYIDALRLINGLSFSTFSARRPLFPGLLAILLTLTNRNLMLSLAILTAITAIACYFTVREIQSMHGPIISTFVLIILFLFYRLHAGISMSENLGVALGTLGFGLLWRGSIIKSYWIIWLGLFITTLALNARAGAFFVLPLLIFWAGFIFRENKSFLWRVIMISICIIVAGFSLNILLTRLISVPSGVPFGNFSYTLYGLASGGKSWVYVFEAHPEILTIKEPEQTKRIYELAFKLIREHPSELLYGAVYNWKMLFSDTWYNIYSYVGGENRTINIIARWVLYLLSLLGLYACFQNRKETTYSLVLVCIIGVFISVPFLPPTDAYRMRPYAASIVILSILPALGLASLLEKVKFSSVFNVNQGLEINSFPVFYSLVLTIILLVGPVLIKFTAKNYSFMTEGCKSDTESILIHFDAGTYINIKKQNLPFLDWMPDFHIGTFRESSHSLPDGNMITWAGTIGSQNTIFLTFDYLSEHGVLIIAPTELLPDTGTFVQMCGNYHNDFGSNIFYVNETKILSP